MRQCEQGGHYYDASIHATCPYCASAAGYPYNNGTQQEGVASAKPNPALNSQSVGSQAVLTKPQSASPDAKTVSMFASMPSQGVDGRTIAIIQKDMGIDPVVGWLVCIRGNEKGRDYRIHSDNNFIGRSEKMDVCVRGDETISRENHAIISFDIRDKVYYFSPGDGRSIVRVNGRAIFQTTVLEAYDIIEIGRTCLMFVPLCGERFEWTREV